MEEIKNSTEAVLESKLNDFVAESTEKRALVEYFYFSRRYPKPIESKLQKDLDMVKSTLEDHGINYHMDLVRSAVVLYILYSTRAKDADLIEKARVLVRLFALGVPASQAITILKGTNWEVMKLGYQKDGLSSQYETSEFLEYCMQATRKFDVVLDRSMEEMKNLTEAVEKKRSDDVCELTQNCGLSLMDGNEDCVNFELVTFTRGYPKCIESKLQEYLPMVKSTLEDYGINYHMNLEECLVSLYTKRSRDADLIEEAKDILRLLTLAVAAPVAVTILKGRHWDIIRLGYQEDGFCSQFGINKEKYYERLKLLCNHATKEIGVMLFCNIQLFGHVLVVLGPASSIKSMRMVARDCIVHGIPPTSRVKSVKDAKARQEMRKRQEALNDYCLARDRLKREVKRPIRFQ